MFDIALIAAAAAMNPAVAEPARNPETFIPFTQRGIRSWEVENDRLLYVLDQKKEWYRVELRQACTALPFAAGLRFDTNGMSRIDRTSSVAVEGQRCGISSVTKGEPPEDPRTD